MGIADFRKEIKIITPKIFNQYSQLHWTKAADNFSFPEGIKELLPYGSSLPRLEIEVKSHKQIIPHKVGVLFSGGPAPGGHDVIAGLFDGLKILNDKSILYGFIGGAKGLINDEVKLLDKAEIDRYRFSGGFDCLKSGRDKLEGQEKLAYALQTCTELDLDGLVIIGGDDSNTNATILAEHFKSKNSKTAVVGIPKTIDGDLRNDEIAISFGFDSACRVYSSLISNLAKDAISMAKHTHFVKLMGRSASNVTLECALRTQPNLALISEEIKANNYTLDDVVNDICNLVEKRASMNKNYGIILIPEGLFESIPQIDRMITALEKDPNSMDQESKQLCQSLPQEIQELLKSERDPHGNLELAKIETESLLIKMVKEKVNVKMDPIAHFFGYEGRSSNPSLFDTHYCYCLGMTAATLIEGKHSGYMAVIENLDKDFEHWSPKAVPLARMIHIEKRNGKDKPVIKKALVDLSSPIFSHFTSVREDWKFEDSYKYTETTQYFGPKEISHSKPLHLFSDF